MTKMNEVEGHCACKMHAIIAAVLVLSAIIIGNMAWGNVVYASGELHTVAYFMGEATGGAVPAVQSQVAPNAIVTALPNSGGLSRVGYVFGGWICGNATYQPGDTFMMPAADVVLSPVWVPAFSVTYLANGGVLGTAPNDNSRYTTGAYVQIMGNTGGLNKDYGFYCWNTKADGSGTEYMQDQMIRMGNENIILYAIYYTNVPLILERDYYTVSCHGNDNTAGSTPVDPTHYSKEISRKETFCVQGNIEGLVKDGYAFAGWNSKADGSGTSYEIGNAFPVFGDIILYAVWMPVYSVTYSANGADLWEVYQPVSYPQGTKVRVIDKDRVSMYKFNCIFAGWCNTPGGSGTTYSPGDVFSITSDVVLYAKWQPAFDSNNKPKRTFSYNGNGNTEGSLPPIQLISSTQEVTITVAGPGTMKKEGYIFDGWFWNSSDYKEGDTIKIFDLSPTLSAKWEPAFTVTYHKNTSTSGSAPTDTNVYTTGIHVTILGNTGNLLNDAVGYFYGWNTSADGTGTTYLPGDKVLLSSSLSLYAMFSSVVVEIPPEILLVSTPILYYANQADSGQAPIDYNYYSAGSSIVVLGNSGGLYKYNHVFAGWNTKSDGSGTSYLPGSTIVIPQNDKFVALFAMFNLYIDTSVRETITVQYERNNATGGSVPKDIKQYDEGEAVIVQGNPGNLYRMNFTFGGWNTQANGGGTTYRAGDTFAYPPVNSSQPIPVLFALWENHPTYYTIQYAKGASVSGTVPTDSTQYQSGSSVTAKNASLTLTGNYFIGWNTAANGSGQTYLPGDVVTMTPNLTLYAYFSPSKRYYVNYSGIGSKSGAPPNDAKRYLGGYSQGATATASHIGALVAESNYYFAGWNTAADGSGTTYGGGDTFTIGASDITLYPIWKAYPHLRTVTYLANGGTGGAPPMDSSTYLPGALVTLRSNSEGLEKSDASFCGWWINGALYKPGGSYSMGDKHIIAFASWATRISQDLKPSICYKGNGNTGGTVPTDEDAYQEYFYRITLPSNTGNLTKNGYLFSGWTDGIFTYWPGEQITTAQNINQITFYAVWVPAKHIVYDSNGSSGGSVPVDASGYREGSFATVSANTGNLEKEGYIFGGWWINAQLYRPGQSVVIGHADTKATAVWILKPVLETSSQISISTPLFYKNNVLVEAAQTGSIRCKFTITNLSNWEVCPAISIAAYKDGKLVKLLVLSPDSITVGEGASRDCEIDIDIPTDCKYIKLFAFDSMGELTPVITPAKIKVQ